MIFYITELHYTMRNGGMQGGNQGFDISFVLYDVRIKMSVEHILLNT